MNEFDEIESLKPGEEKNNRLITFYKENVKIDNWLTNNYKYSVIAFSNRTEYKMNKIYHRLNGPAIDYKNEDMDKYYYKGILFDKKDEWEKITQKEIRKIKIKKLNKKSSE